MNPSAPSTPAVGRRAASSNQYERSSGTLSANAGGDRRTKTMKNAEEDATRPTTHDGRLHPSTPARQKRNYVSLSPRQISFKLSSEEADETHRASSAAYRHNKPASTGDSGDRPQTSVRMGDIET